MSTALIVLPEEHIRSLVVSYEMQATELEIVDQASFDDAGQLLQKIKAEQKVIDEACGPRIKQAHALHKSLVGDKNALIDELIGESETLVKGKINDYVAEQERLAREEQRRLAIEAAQKRKAAEEEARKLEAEGEAEIADMVRQDAEMDAAPAPTIAKPKAAGVSVRSIWRAEVTDFKAFLNGVMDGTVPIELVQVNDQELQRMARAQKGAMKLKGTRVWEEKSTAVRS